MGIINSIIKFFSFKEPEKKPTFTISEPFRGDTSQNQNSEVSTNPNSSNQQQLNKDTKKDKRASFKTKIINEKLQQRKNVSDIRSKLTNKAKQSDSDSKQPDYGNMEISLDININKQTIEEIFHLPENKDLIIKEFKIQYKTVVQAMIVCIDGMVDKVTMHSAVLEPLMILGNINWAAQHFTNQDIDATNAKNNTIEDYIINQLMIVHSVKKDNTFGQIINNILIGNTAVFIDGCERAILIETKGWKDRAVEQPVNEKTIKGPHEAFTENFRINTGLVRKLLPNKDLITDTLTIGAQQNILCAVMYLKNIANPSLVQEVKRRVSSIKTDFVAGTGGLEQFIEDHPFLPMPQALTTERPDRVVASLLEGRVALILSNSPEALIVPVSFWTLIHSPEDAYLKFPFGTLLRFIRLFAMLATLFSPALYIAVTMYHQEMIPTDLLITIVGARETIPFPIVIEVLLLEISFELIREAGVRIPGAIGQTIGIVGAIILGQAAVSAGIVSPIIIVIIAITALGSFAIPDYILAFSFRFLRFVYLLAASIFGLFGLSVVAVLHLAVTASMNSFGMSFLTAVAPKTASERDTIVRYPIWMQEKNPFALKTIKPSRQPKISRGWIESDSKQQKED